MKVKQVTFREPDDAYRFRCPGCNEWHIIYVKGKVAWEFNGDVNSPTFTPSLKLTADGYCCHSFIRAGKIQFLGDCTHELAGQTVDLPEIEAAEAAKEQRR